MKEVYLVNARDGIFPALILHPGKAVHYLKVCLVAMQASDFS